MYHSRWHPTEISKTLSRVNEYDDRDNEYDGKIENDVALKWPSRLVVVLAFDVPKSIALYGTREEEIQSFLLKLENSNFPEKDCLLQSKQT